jgi:hypothetical protein
MLAKRASRSMLLGRAVAMYAGLSPKFSSTFIYDQLNSFERRLRHIFRAERDIIEKARLTVCGVESFSSLFSSLSAEHVIIAGSEFGATPLTVTALVSSGVKLAGLYWELSSTYRAIFECGNAILVDMNAHSSILSVFKTLQSLQEGGYALFLLSDAPGNSRERFDFLGYSVVCSSFIEVYARFNNCVVLPLGSEIISPTEISLLCSPPYLAGRGLTQRLLSDLEALIYAKQTSYHWSPASIIFSDPCALSAALRALPEIVAWRETRDKEACSGLPDLVAPTKS